MTIFMEILGAVKLLFESMKMMRQLLKFLKDEFGDDPGKFIKDSHDVFREVNKAKTKEEKKKAAKKISDLYKRLG